MTKRSHKKAFDQETKLKLEIMRAYIRKWLPVFFSRPSHPRVNIYDFFAGPGRDVSGNPGSPIIIKEEVVKYYRDPSTPKAEGVNVTLYFNDIDKDNYEQLMAEVESWQTANRYHVRLENKEFSVAFQDELPEIQSRGSANLVLLDQYGVKQINDYVFQRLIESQTTDIIFFISSSYIRRFITEDSIQQIFSLPIEKIKNIDIKEIHRYICNKFYKGLIPADQEYYITPFSIRKEDGNIYGLIFGSGSLLGLDKFLQVCWTKDTITGEANYDIDNDPLRRGQLSLLPEENVIKKQDRFMREVITLLCSRQCDNRTLYRFGLENGFAPKQVNDVLKSLQTTDKIEVIMASTKQLARKGAFYITGLSLNSQPLGCPVGVVVP